MFSQKVQQDVDVLAIIEREIVDARPKIRRLMFRVATGPAVLKTLRGLMVEADRPTYPIRWQSQRQRRYVRAKLRRENNLPYMRTHRIAQGWTAVVGEGMSIEFVNKAPGVAFVQGKYQQIMHMGRWPNAPFAIAAATADITAETAGLFMRSFGKKGV